MSMTIEELTPSESLDRAYKFCLETHKTAPAFYEMGPHELRSFWKEMGNSQKEYKGIPIKPMAQAGINFKLQ